MRLAIRALRQEPRGKQSMPTQLSCCCCDILTARHLKQNFVSQYVHCILLHPSLFCAAAMTRVVSFWQGYDR